MSSAWWFTLSKVLNLSATADILAAVASEPVVVVKFTAPSRCAPCRAFAPHFAAASERSEAVFVSASLDDNPDLGNDFNITSVPTVLLFRNGDYAKTLNERTTIRLLNEMES